MSIFSHILAKRPKRNKFDLSHERKFSFAMGKLTPILVQEVVPGDKFRVKSEVFIRMAPMLAPLMHRINVYTHYFFVPNRLIWNEWEDFITGGKDGTLEPVPPYIDTADLSSGAYSYLQSGSLFDYMGCPVLPKDATLNNNMTFSALPFRAYQLIYNEYYRDQNLSDPVSFGISSGKVSTGLEVANLLTLRKRAWEKDYFTSALPWAQRGGDVEVPFGAEAEVNYKTISEVRNLDGSLATTNSDLRVIDTHPTDGNLFIQPIDQGGFGRIENIESIDISGSPININDLRRSISLQRWLEKNARGGARYIEQILSHFGVKSSDARLQRPQYLGGGRQPVTISEVLQTYQDEEAQSNPLGTMGGHGVSVGNTNGFTKFFEEHGWIIGLISVLPRTAYQQGLPRHFTRWNKFDYYWPDFANIGEQEILKKELYFDWEVNSDNSSTFGYTPRYSEYKYAPSTVHGAFRDTLRYWHLGRYFSNRPELNEAFVMADPRTDVFAVEDEEHMYCQTFHKVDALRPMPYFGTPTL